MLHRHDLVAMATLVGGVSAVGRARRRLRGGSRFVSAKGRVASSLTFKRQIHGVQRRNTRARSILFARTMSKAALGSIGANARPSALALKERLVVRRVASTPTWETSLAKGHCKVRMGTASRSGWTRVLALELSLVLLALAVYQLVATHIERPALFASDFIDGYLPAARRFLETQSHTPEQLSGPWVLNVHSFIHPPAALPLFTAFLILPSVLWWVAPIGMTAYAVWRLRPAAWAWPLMALCLVWPRSTGSLLTGNSDLWAMAFVAAGALWGWPVVLLLVKPTFAPLGLIGVRRRSTWIASGVALAFIVVTIPLWVQWWTALANNTGLGVAYSVLNLPLVLLPAIAWLARSAPTVDEGTVDGPVADPYPDAPLRLRQDGTRADP